MNRRWISVFLISLTLLPALACQTLGKDAAKPDADIDATVHAAVSATTAVQPDPTASVISDPTISVTPTATLDYGALAEEALVELIEESMADVVAESDESAEAAAGSVDDGVVTQEEADEVAYLLAETEAVIAECVELVTVHDDLYGELASETLNLLIEMEDDLDSLTSAVLTIANIYDDLEFAATDAVELTDEVIAEIENSAGIAQTVATRIVARRDEWKTWATTMDEDTLELLLSLQPSNIPDDRITTILAIHQYAESVNSALADGDVTVAELEQIAALAANARAGIEANGGPQLKSLDTAIEGMTAQLVRGQLDAALSAMESLNSLIDRLPAVQ